MGEDENLADVGAEDEHDDDVGSGTTDASTEDSVTKPVHATADSAALDHALLERIHRRAQERLFSVEPMVTRIGRFVVLGQIGEGGMGIIFAAYDEQLDRKVAVKVLREDELPEPDDRLRFEREAKALARISHRNIVTIYENYGFATEVLVASVRSPLHVSEAAMVGAQIATVPFKILKQMFKHPLTDIGIERFLEDYRKSQA